MAGNTRQFSVRTQRRSQLLEITDEVAQLIAESGVSSGLCVVYVPHTTAAVCINENADPDVREDAVAPFSPASSTARATRTRTSRAS